MPYSHSCAGSLLATAIMSPREGFRLIPGVTGETVSVPLVGVTLQSSLCSGSFLCGLATFLPTGIDMLLGNDLCPGAPAVDVAVTAPRLLLCVKKWNCRLR